MVRVQSMSCSERLQVNFRAMVCLIPFALTLVLAADGETTLAQAVKTGDRAAVQKLVKQPGQVNAAEPDGTTPLHWAARADDLEIARLLLAAGANANAANRYGVTPL